MRQLSAFLAAAALVAGAAMPALAARGAGRRGQQVRPITGRIVTKGDKDFDLQSGNRNAPQTTKITVDQDTKLSKFEAGAQADLTENYLVVVGGAREGNKITAAGVLRLAKMDGEPAAADWRAATAMGRSGARMLGGQPRAAAGQPRPQPVVGKISSAQPLKIKTQAGEEVEVETSAATRIFLQSDVTFADLQQGSNVIVVPTAAPAGGAATARSIIQLPRMGRQGGARRGGAAGGRRGGRRGGAAAGAGGANN